MKQRQSTCTTNKISRNSTILFFLILIGMLLGIRQSQAQLMTTGTINGTVLDQSGSVLLGASISITDVGTKTVTQTVSNSDGSFSQSGLQSGNYAVTVSSPGFTTFNEKGIYLEPTGTYTVHAAMKAGAVSTTVTVTGSPAPVQTTTSEISNTVSGEEAEALPLNGRNYQGLGSLMPGVINTSPIASMGTGGYNTSNALNVNGGGSTGSFYTLDGIWNENTGSETQTTIMPNPDEISEIKVFQNNYDAKYSLMGASVVLVETKNGTDQFHGGAWEFLRNTDLDATQYFLTAPSVLHWNIFGYDVGGPLFIPHVYNRNRKKTFFYFNSQWVRQTQGGIVNGATPTAVMRAGMFPMVGSGSPYLTTTNGGWLKDPTKAGTCNAISQAACFPDNQIPDYRINQSALALLNAMAPLPNAQTSQFNNYVNTNPTTTRQLDEEAKVDHNISSKLRLTGEYFYEGQTSNNPNASRMGSPFTTNYDTFKTDNQLAQFQLTQLLSPSMTNQTSIAMNNYDITHAFAGLADISQIPGYSQNLPYTGGYLQNQLPHITFSGGWSQFGTDAGETIPRATDLEDTITDNWSWLRGKHYIEAGGTILFGTKRQWTTGDNTTGDFSFSGNFTGNPIADYLLGDSNSFSQGNDGFRKAIHYPIDTVYAEDQWKATQRLTINAGVRFLYMPFPHEQAGYMNDFDPAQFNPANAPIVATNGNITPTANYDPANGIIRNGINGVPLNLTDAHKYYWAPSVGFAWDVFGNGRTSLRGGYAITYNRNGGMGAACSQGCVSYPLVQQVELTNTNFPNPVGVGTTPPLTASSVSGQVLDYKIGSIQTYSLSFQQQLGTNWTVSVAGAGNISNNLQTSLNINQPAPVPGYDFNPNLNGTGPGHTSGTAYASAYYAPYQGYSSISISEPIGKSNWNALEVGLRHPVGHNLYLTVAYTWSHDLDNAGGFQNVYDIGAAYGNSSLDTPQVFTTSLIYSLPWFQNGSRLKQTVLGGWKYSDMTSIYSETFTTMALSGSNNGIAGRPNQIAPVSYPKKWKTPGSLWFNTNSFAKPAPGFFGNVGDGTIRTPGLIDFNMAAYKTFPLFRQTTLQFRAEFFNVFNHSNPNGPGVSFGAGAFGEITSVRDPRIGEMALKLNF